MEKIRVAIVGATGYTGAEVLRLILGHRHAEVTLCTSREPGAAVASLHRQFTGLVDLSLEAFAPDVVAARADVAFVGLPHHAAMESVIPLYERGMRVIDLSADFRLRDLQTYRDCYGEHLAPPLLAVAAYGLPELFRDELRNTRLVATPGCYPTSVILPLAPLLRHTLVRPRGIVADCKSGASGAGRGLSPQTHYVELEGGLRAYKVGSHRHQPEMEELLGRASGVTPEIFFTPHLVPMIRGISSAIYCELEDGVEGAAIREHLVRAYAGEPFVKVLPEGHCPDTKHVAGTNYVHLNVVVDEARRRVVLLCALDNLVKGASGAAVQCMNLLFGLDETEGLRAAALFP